MKNVKEIYYKWYFQSFNWEIEMFIYGYQGYLVILFFFSQG